MPFTWRSRFDPFPIVVCCRNSLEAEPFIALKPYIDLIAERQLFPPQQIIAALKLLKKNKAVGSILTKKGCYYTVLCGRGKQEGLYMTWYVSSHSPIRAY